jgi:N-ethylmaleimide reductase
MTTDPLFTATHLGALSLKHRMAPLTRLRSRQPGDVPNARNAEYYGQRASDGGLIISEATDISPTARGYPGAPGVYSGQQITGWQLVTNVLHRSQAQSDPATARLASIMLQAVHNTIPAH